MLRTVSLLSATLALALSTAPVAAQATVPPDGVLTVAGHGPFVGTRGTYCFRGEVEGCVDAEWVIPDAKVAAPIAAELRFRLADGTLITDWVASQAPARGTADDAQYLAGEEGISVEEVAFTGPGEGDWVLSVEVRFESGSAVYNFRLQVGLPETSTAAAAAPRAPMNRLLPLLLLAGVLAAAAAMGGWNMRANRRLP